MWFTIERECYEMLAHLIEESTHGSLERDGGFGACSHCEGTSDEEGGQMSNSCGATCTHLWARLKFPENMFRGKIKCDGCSSPSTKYG